VEAKTIIYIVLGILYYAYKFSKSRKKKQEENTSEPVENKYDRLEEKEVKPSKSAGKSFQEILEEFVEIPQQKEKEYKPPVIEKPTLKVEKTPVLEVPTHKQNLERFKEFEIEEEERNEFQEMFSDLDSTKKAFVASEVFSRKY